MGRTVGGGDPCQHTWHLTEQKNANMQRPQVLVVGTPQTLQGPQKLLPALPGIVSGFRPDAMRPAMMPARRHHGLCVGQSAFWHFTPQYLQSDEEKERGGRTRSRVPDLLQLDSP